MGLSVENLTLTDFMDVPTLQEIQDSFAAVADVKATITDAAAKADRTPVQNDLPRRAAIHPAMPQIVASNAARRMTTAANPPAANTL